MATTIKSTALDFDTIKNNLKTYFQAQPEFADYNFEGSGLSNILDVLAYNTHYNALAANFALNESFLGTAQLRSSMVSLSEGIGYIPDSRNSSQAVINLSVTFTAVDRPQKIELSAGQQFFSSVENKSYIFQTIEALEAVDNGSGFYIFTTAEGSPNIPIYEGISRTKKFLVGQYIDASVYVIPDPNLDLNTCIVKVYETPSSDVYTSYTNITEAISLSNSSTIYLLKESPNGNFELSFGNGTALGKIPVAGNMIEVDYLSCSGPDANGATTFTTDITLPAVPVNDYNVDSIVTVNNSAGGAYKEDIESIRKNAPYLYAAQNRMVTADDYAALVLRHYSSLITDISAWGGQDNVVREFGKIFLSILFNDDISAGTIETTKTNIRILADQLSVLSFGLEFAEPEITYLETGISFDFNTTLTDLPLGTMQQMVKNASIQYFTDNLGKFGQNFRLSNLLTDVDDVSTSVLSSSAIIRMQQRVTPILSYNNVFTLRYPVAIQNPDDVYYMVTSSAFVFNTRTSRIKNKLNSNILQIVDDVNGEILADNIGIYSGNTVQLTAFSPAAILGGVSYIKISAVPGNINTISTKNNEVLYHDADASYALGTIVYTS